MRRTAPLRYIHNDGGPFCDLRIQLFEYACHVIASNKHAIESTI